MNGNNENAIDALLLFSGMLAACVIVPTLVTYGVMFGLWLARVTGITP